MDMCNHSRSICYGRMMLVATFSAITHQLPCSKLFETTFKLSTESVKSASSPSLKT